MLNLKRVNLCKSVTTQQFVHFLQICLQSAGARDVCAICNGFSLIRPHVIWMFYKKSMPLWSQHLHTQIQRTFEFIYSYIASRKDPWPIRRLLNFIQFILDCNFAIPIACKRFVKICEKCLIAFVLIGIREREWETLHKLFVQFETVY